MQIIKNGINTYYSSLTSWISEIQFSANLSNNGKGLSSFDLFIQTFCNYKHFRDLLSPCLCVCLCVACMCMCVYVCSQHEVRRMYFQYEGRSLAQGTDRHRALLLVAIAQPSQNENFQTFDFDRLNFSKFQVE